MTKRFRVVRGVASTETTKGWSTGLLYTAPDARDAVRQDIESAKKSMLLGLEPAPILNVYELVLVPTIDWT